VRRPALLGDALATGNTGHDRRSAVSSAACGRGSKGLNRTDGHCNIRALRDRHCDPEQQAKSFAALVLRGCREGDELDDFRVGAAGATAV